MHRVKYDCWGDELITQVQPLNQATGLLRRLDLSYRMGLMLVFFVVVLTHIPLPFNSPSTDDYLIRANLVGDKTLYDKGMILASPDKSFLQGISQAFHFYSEPAGTVQAYLNYGNLPWWVATDPKRWRR